MTPGRSESKAEEHRSPSAAREERSGTTVRRRPQIYLRTVYPLNPGIPHFLDFPGNWD